MNPSATFYSTVHDLPERMPLADGAILMHGRAIDERGESVLASASLSQLEKIPITYDDQTMRIGISGVESYSDRSVPLFRESINSKPVVLEATTMGFPELFCSIFALVRLRIERFQVIYVEPKGYARTSNQDTFALSEHLRGFHPIPPAVIDLSSDEVDAGVFFLGYENERLERALEGFQMILSKDVKVVFGVPAYQPGWELNAIVPHLPILSESKTVSIAYCSASNAGSAYVCLEETRKSLPNGKRMFVAPIGTKPCGVATAVFVSLFPEQAGILYDHPQKRRKRSEGVNVWHVYTINIKY